MNPPTGSNGVVKMPAAEFWTYSAGVSSVLHIPKGIMLGVHLEGRFMPIAPARAVFGRHRYRAFWRGRHKLITERAEKLWTAWLMNNRVPLSEEHVRAIRLEEILSGQA